LPERKKGSVLSSCFLVNIGLTGFNFPAKRLRKIRGAQNTHAPFLLISFAIVAVSNFCLQKFIFPAKKLRKDTGAQNTHAPLFLIFFCRLGILNLKEKSIKYILQ